MRTTHLGEAIKALVTENRNMCNATLEEVIQSWMASDDQAKSSALRILRGEHQVTAQSRVPSGPQLITMGKACELLGCSRTTLWRAIQAGSLEKVELFKNSYRLRLDDVLALAGGKEDDRERV